MIGQLLTRLAAWPARLRAMPDPGRIVTICHCHHAELVAELAKTLRRLPPGAAIHISSSNDAVLELWRTIGPLPGELSLHRVENRGRDMRPFFEIAQRLTIEPDTLVLKLHGKRSDYTQHGKNWRRDLLNGLLPDRRTPGFVAERFRLEPRLGLLGAPKSYIAHPVYWGQNRDTIRRIMREKFGAAPDDSDLGFFAGSMFWMRGALLRDLLPSVDLDAFAPEPLPQDGSYAHAIERIIGMAARRMGWQAGEIGDPAPLDLDAIRDRKIPYI